MTVEEPETKLFSIREYVSATRCRDIFCSWPFSVKNLELCLKHGIKNVLPPLEPSFNSSLQSLRKVVAGSSSHLEDDKYDFLSYHDKEIEAQFVTDESGLYFHESIPEVYNNAEKNRLSFSNLSDPVNQSFSTTTNGYQNIDQSTKSASLGKKLRQKRRTDKRKRKKRSMVDILAVAKHCTLRISLH